MGGCCIIRGMGWMTCSCHSLACVYTWNHLKTHHSITPEPVSESTRTASFLQGRIQKKHGCPSAGRWKDIRTHSWFFIRIAIPWWIGVKPCPASCVGFSQTCLPKHEICGASDLCLREISIWNTVGLGHLQRNVVLFENRYPQIHWLIIIIHMRSSRGSCSWDVCASGCQHICWQGVQGLSNWNPVVLVRCMVSPAMWCGGWWKHNDLRLRDSCKNCLSLEQIC